MIARRKWFSFRSIILAVVGVLLIWWWFALPDPLFHDPYSSILLDKEGNLLSARIARDEQWRFPELDSVPDAFRHAVIAFEDKRFEKHIGVDFIAMARAMRSNLRARKVVSGGSTLTMQLMRIARKGNDRSIPQKFIEVMLAVRAELRYSKDDIMRLYASHAPFGGNVVGLEAASWRYYGKSPEVLSWAEAACLAVLPNSPALIHPGRGREILRGKRDLVLDRLWERGVIDSTEAQLAKLEPLPDAPHALPDGAPHLLEHLRTSAGERIRSTIDRQLQQEAQFVLETHHLKLSQNGIHNGAILVLDTETGEVLAYVGNVPDPKMRHQNAVDMIQAPRSSGSILKPLLYASAFSDGKLLPKMLLEDVPTNIRGYQPENFSRSYRGMVPADEALVHSLNVTAVLLLKEYGIERFRQDLLQSGIKTIRFSAEHYGLPLVLGGAEVNLWDLCGVYASMGRSLSHAYSLNHKYNPADFHHATGRLNEKPKDRQQTLSDQPPVWDYAAIWHTFNTMRDLNRPDEEGQWESFQTEKEIAWKTGTSFGFRDAWAVGVSPRFTVGVWIGNADGEGRPGLMGARAAAPVMFDIFRNLPGAEWWSPPFDAMAQVSTCSISGFLAGPDCPEVDSLYIPLKGFAGGQCPYHQLIYTDAQGKYQFHADCASLQDMVPQSWFVLPPAAAWLYGRNHPMYKPLPPLHPSCLENGNAAAEMQLLYPSADARIFIPRELNGEKGHTVFRAAHRSVSADVFWYMDREFIGKTREFHTVALQPEPGIHTIILVDEQGERVERTFEVVGSE